MFSTTMARGIFLLFLLPFSLIAFSGNTQLRAGYFYPTSSLFRQVYGGGVEGEFETAAHLYRGLDLFANVGIFRESGVSTGLKEPTRVAIYPLSVGLKYHFKIVSCFDFYLGAAPTYTWTRIHNSSSFVTQNIHKQSWGFVSKSGFVYEFFSPAFFDFYVDYYYTRISKTPSSGITSQSCNIGGLRAGAGLGVKY